MLTSNFVGQYSLIVVALIIGSCTNMVQSQEVFNCNSQNGVKMADSITNSMIGSIIDGPGGIRSNTWCEWSVQTPLLTSGPPRRIRLTFRMTDLMAGEDFVWVYDDAISSTVPVERIAGSYTPQPIISTSDKGFRIEYKSSEFGVGAAVAPEQGFQIDYQVINVKGVCNPNPCSDLSKCVEDEMGVHRCTRCPIGYTGDGSKKDGCVKVQPCSTPSVRREIRSLSQMERDIFFGAIRNMRSSGVWDELMWIHADKFNFNFAHLTDGFLPWHRQYLIMMEDALRSSSPEANCISIPYWDWTMDAAAPMSSIMFTDAWFGGTGVATPGNDKKCVRSGQFSGPILGNDCLQRDLNGAGFIATREEILNAISSNDNFRQFSRALELFHDTVHRFIGGTMILDNSADEPLFFVHHSFIDMIWSVWQDCHDYDLIPAGSVQPQSNVFMGGFERGALGTTVNTDYNLVMPYRLSHFSPQISASNMMSIEKLSISYDNMHWLSRPMTIEWFDPRWTTCTIENLEVFKKHPNDFVAASKQTQGFQILAFEPSTTQNATRWPMKGNSTMVVYTGQIRHADEICNSDQRINFSDKCMCVKRWSAHELHYVAKTLPSCQQKELLVNCLPSKLFPDMTNGNVMSMGM